MMMDDDDDDLVKRADLINHQTGFYNNSFCSDPCIHFILCYGFGRSQ